MIDRNFVMESAWRIVISELSLVISEIGARNTLELFSQR